MVGQAPEPERRAAHVDPAVLGCEGPAQLEHREQRLEGIVQPDARDLVPTPNMLPVKCPDATLNYPFGEEEGLEVRLEGEHFVLGGAHSGAGSRGDVEERPSLLAAERDLTWGHLAPDEAGLTQIVYVPIDGLLKNAVVDQIPWGKNSAHMASITRQPPFRVAVHARTWLREPGQGPRP